MYRLVILFVLVAVSLQAEGQVKCADGSASSPSMSGVCPAGFTMTNDKICCQSVPVKVEDCASPLGPAIMGECPSGFKASDAGNCCRDTTILY